MSEKVPKTCISGHSGPIWVYWARRILLTTTGFSSILDTIVVTLYPLYLVARLSMPNEADLFLRPQTPSQRHYESLRAVIVEKMPVAQAAARFGYTVDALRSLVRDFRREPTVLPFFAVRKPGRRPVLDETRSTIVRLRKQNYSVYDIQQLLRQDGVILSYRAIARVLKAEDFARLPQRPEEERPDLGIARPLQPPKADLGEQPYQSGTTLSTDGGGAFLFVPLLVHLKFDRLIAQAGYPGSTVIPPLNYLLSALAMKLLGKERWSHVMSVSFDEGLGLFAGLNVLPKTTALTTYSYRVTREMNLKLLGGFIKQLKSTSLLPGETFNLDFSPIPHRGRESVLESNYVSRRSRSEKSVLTFLAQDGETRAFCYSNATCLKRDRNDEVLAFVDFWKKTYGRKPPHLVFDSRLTTYDNLAKLAKRKILFITVRRRGSQIVKKLAATPARDWQTVSLDVPDREFQHPKVHESSFEAKPGLTLRQLAVKDLGHKSPTLLITNDKDSCLKDIIIRYAHRMLIENGIAENIGFFHFDALSSAIALNVDFDVTLTLLANSLYKLFLRELRGYESLAPKQAFRKIVDRKAQIHIGEKEVRVAFPRLAFNSVLLNAGFDTKQVAVPWWRGRRLVFTFG